MDLEFRIFKLLKGWIAMTMKVIKYLLQYINLGNLFDSMVAY